MSESRELCLVDVEHYSTNAFWYVNYCINQLLADLNRYNGVRLGAGIWILCCRARQSLESCSVNFRVGVEHSAQALFHKNYYIKPNFPALARLLRFAAVPSPPSRPSSLFRTTTSHRLVALMFFPILVSQSAATSVGQNLKSADLERFVGLFMRLAESMPALRSSIPDFSFFGETYSNMVVDFNVSVQKEDRNSTSPNSIPAEKIKRFRLNL